MWQCEISSLNYLHPLREWSGFPLMFQQWASAGCLCRLKQSTMNMLGQSSPEDGGGTVDGRGFSHHGLRGRWRWSKCTVIGSLTVGKEWCIVYQNIETASGGTERLFVIIGCGTWKRERVVGTLVGTLGQSITNNSAKLQYE